MSVNSTIVLTLSVPVVPTLIFFLYCLHESHAQGNFFSLFLGTFSTDIKELIIRMIIESCPTSAWYMIRFLWDRGLELPAFDFTDRKQPGWATR